jgi:hypothetical protein
MKLAKLLIFFLAITLIGCNASADQNPEQENYHFAISPATSKISPALALCANRSIGDSGQFRISVNFPSQFDSNSHDLIIQIGETAPHFTFLAQIASENFSIVSHLSNALASLSSSEVLDIFRGQINNWAEINGEERSIQVWIASESDEGRQYLEEQILAGRFTSSNAKIASSPEHLLESIVTNENAIGLLPDAWIDASINSVALPIALPIFAASENEAEGAISEIIACLQSGEGQEQVRKIYSP